MLCKCCLSSIVGCSWIIVAFFWSQASDKQKKIYKRHQICYWFKSITKCKRILIAVCEVASNACFAFRWDFLRFEPIWFKRSELENRLRVECCCLMVNLNEVFYGLSIGYLKVLKQISTFFTQCIWIESTGMNMQVDSIITESVISKHIELERQQKWHCFFSGSGIVLLIYFLAIYFQKTVISPINTTKLKLIRNSLRICVHEHSFLHCFLLVFLSAGLYNFTFGTSLFHAVQLCMDVVRRILFTHRSSISIYIRASVSSVVDGIWLDCTSYHYLIIWYISWFTWYRTG